MSLWLARATVLVANGVQVILRAPHGKRSASIKVIKDRRGALETFLLTLAGIGFFPAILWTVIPVHWFADYSSGLPLWIAGTLCYAAGLWLLYRSHADLGRNWSITLEVREDHALVTGGVYRHVRHPMYSGLMLWALGQALVLANWLVGPAYLVTFGILFAFRVRREEKMLLDQFGASYEAYMARTKRLVPLVW